MTWPALTLRQWLTLAALPVAVGVAYLAAAAVAGMEFIDARPEREFGWPVAVAWIVFCIAVEFTIEERKMLTRQIAALKQDRPVRCWWGIRHVRWLFAWWTAMCGAMLVWDRSLGPPAIAPSDAEALDRIWRGVDYDEIADAIAAEIERGEL